MFLITLYKGVIMGKIGLYLMIFGIGSFLLNLAGREFVILMWIDMFGPLIGMAIRIAMIVGGALLFFKAKADAAALQRELEAQE